MTTLDTPTPDGSGDEFDSIARQLTDVFAPEVAPPGADCPGGGSNPEPTPTPERGPVPHPPTPDTDHTEGSSAPVTVVEAMERDVWNRPTGPRDQHELPVTFPLRHAIKIGFAMTVIAAGIGQTLFFAGFFGGGLTGYALAVGIAAFAEVTMIGAGDSALRHKVERNNGWQSLLLVSAAVAVGATTMQVAHWMADDEPVMALTFGAASLLGWVVHIASGLIAAHGHLAREDAYQAELDRRRQKQEAAETDTEPELVSPAPVESTPATSTPAPVRKPKQKSQQAQRKQSAPPRVEGIQFFRDHPNATYATFTTEFRERGYTSVPTRSTVTRYRQAAQQERDQEVGG